MSSNVDLGLGDITAFIAYCSPQEVAPDDVYDKRVLEPARAMLRQQGCTEFHVRKDIFIPHLRKFFTIVDGFKPHG